MRNYWLRIALGALAIFSVGMVARMLINRGVRGVRGVVQGTGPITLPIAFVPFKLDGEKLGTINQVKVFRSAPDKVKSVNVLVRLADSVNPNRLGDCILVAEGFERFNSQTTIRCASAADTTEEDLAEIGEISLTQGDRSFKLLMPRDAIRELTDSDADSASVGADSASQAAQRKADSIAEITAEKAESVGEAAGRRADSIVRAHRLALDSLHRLPGRMADSARRR
jgi:hypothetical protein